MAPASGDHPRRHPLRRRGPERPQAEPPPPPADEPRPPPVDPLRWSMVQDVIRALGKPVDPEELERVGRPLQEEGEAESAAREPIEVPEPPPMPPTRFDGRPIPAGPMAAEPRPPARREEGSALGIFAILVLLLLLGLAVVVALDFLRWG